MRYRTYTLRIEATDDAVLSEVWSSDLDSAIQDAEDVINDRLPEGFYCKIDDSSEGVDIATVEALERFARDGT